MFSPEELPKLKSALLERAQSDRRLLDDLRADVRPLASNVRCIKARSTTSISLVASDGGNNQLVFDPFHFQLVRVVDSYGKQLCLDVISPTTDTDRLSAAQFNPDGTPNTALGRLLVDLQVSPPTLHGLSPMIPPGDVIRNSPETVSPSWVMVYRDLCEWAVLYENICYKEFATDTLIVRDGLLRSKIFSRDLFIKFRKLIEQRLSDLNTINHRKVYLVGIAKHSKVLMRYNLAMAIEDTLPAGDPCYVRIPRELEAKAYVWPEYARGSEVEGQDGELPKFVAGDMFFVRFGARSSDPIWTVDILSAQSHKAAEVFGYLLADAIDGFPVPLYPRCLQKAHEHAQIVDLDLTILQDGVFNAIRTLLPLDKQPVLDAHILKSDVSEERYG